MNLRGAYVARLDLAQPHLLGVADKIRAQASALQELPACVDLYHLADGKVVRDGLPIGSAGAGSFGRRISHYILFHLLVGTRRAPLDFLYMRYQGSSPLLLWMLRALRRRNPGIIVIVEFPSWPYHSEAVSTREKVLLWIDRHARNRLCRYVDRVVTFSREPSILGIRTIRTDNGVDLDRIAVLPRRAADGSLRLIGLANLSFWHGYDRVIEGIANYYAGGGTRDIHFDVVGTGSELGRLEKLVETHGLGARVLFHGARRGRDLEAIMANADIGISSIGMHRLDVDTSNLKSREFCARGLPFVIAYTDRDFPPGLRFAYHAPADDSAVDIGALVDFHRRLLAEEPDYPAKMRAYAEQHLAWRVKMGPVLDVLRDLSSEGGGR